MKYVFTLALASFFLVAHAQRRLRFGIEAGLNSASQSIELANEYIHVDKDALASYSLSALFDLRLTRSVSLQSGLSYQRKGVKTDETYYMPPYIDFLPDPNKTPMPVTPYRSTISLNYLEIPLFLSGRFKIAPLISAFAAAGPYAAIGLGGNRKNEDGGKRDHIFEGNEGSNGYQKEDYGLNFKTGLEFRRLSLNVKYSLGLSNIAPQPNLAVVDYIGDPGSIQGIVRDKIRNRVFSINLGYWLW